MDILEQQITIDDITRPVHEWCKLYGITKTGFNYRIQRGMTPEQAVTQPKRSGPLDITGQRFGNLYVLYRDLSAQSKRNTRWIVRCDCGNTYSILGGTLRNKGVKQCKKCVYTFNDLVGQKFGKLEVIKYAGTYISPSGSKHHRWTVRCNCGHAVDVLASHLLTGATKQCRQCKANGQKLNGRMSHRAFERARRNAARRNIEFAIDKVYLCDLFDNQSGICPYSGIKIGFATSLAEARRGGDTASLDRIDSSRGYVPGNVQWVHKIVNIMKARMLEDEFLDWCKKIVEHASTKNQCR